MFTLLYFTLTRDIELFGYGPYMYVRGARQDQDLGSLGLG